MKKTTVYLEDDLLRAVKINAVRTGKRDYQVFEAALKSYLGMDVLGKLWSRKGLPEKDSLNLAYSELRKTRKGK